MIRSSKTKRLLAWVGLFAITLIAVMPTLSQLRASAWPVSHGNATALHDGSDARHHESAETSPASGHDHCPGGKPDDCWKKCGYCDFLGHAPSLAGVPHLTILLAPADHGIVARAESPPRQAARFNAAHPRGPPSLLV